MEKVELATRGERWSLVDGDTVIATGDLVASRENVIMSVTVVRHLLDTINSMRRAREEHR